LADLVAVAPSAQAAGSVSVTAFNCAATVDPASTDPAAFAAACTQEADGLTFALTAGGIPPRRRATAPGQPAAWPGVTGDFTLSLETPKGEPAVAFCQSNGGTPQRFDAPAGEIKSTLPADTALACTWYRLPAAQPTPKPSPPPTSTPQPTAPPKPTSPPTSTPQPTATPTQAASPTATQFPTATPFPTPAATATPAVTPTPTKPALPTPIDTGPPEMFRGDPVHTGRQADQGPAGDPVLLWRYPLGKDQSSSPIVAAGTVYVGAEDGLYAIDAASGTVRWLFPTELPITATPAVVAGVVYVGGQDGIFYAVDAGTGLERWRFPTGSRIRASAVVADGVVYFTSYDANAYALDAETGEERWSTQHLGDDFTSSPALADGTLFVGVGDLDGGWIYALDASTGEPIWRRQVAATVGSSPTILGGVVYAGSDDGFLYGFDVKSNKRVCRFETGKIIRSSPAALDGVIVIGNRAGQLYAVNAGNSCQQLWQFSAGDWIDSSPAVAGGTLYVGSKDNFLYALNSGTGEVLWKFEVGLAVFSSPVVADGVVYFTSRDGYLYALGGTDNQGASAPPPADAARPPDLPVELFVGDARYRLDRVVTLDRTALQPLGKIGQLQLFAHDVQDPTAPIYTNRPPQHQGDDEDTSILVRYLPERIGAAQKACPAEQKSAAGQIQTPNNDTYVFAGPETDSTTDQLTQVTDSPDLGAIYAVSDQPPVEDLFADTPDGLQRFVLLDADGLPEALRGNFPFAGQTYAFAEDVTGQTDKNKLVRIGCAGPFAVAATTDTAKPPFGRIYAVIADKVLAFDPVASPSPASASVFTDDAVVVGVVPVLMIFALGKGRTRRSAPTTSRHQPRRGGPPCPPCPNAATPNEAGHAP
jgi:outer membrane protein assembly factor BamB